MVAVADEHRDRYVRGNHQTKANKNCRYIGIGKVKYQRKTHGHQAKLAGLPPIKRTRCSSRVTTRIEAKRIEREIYCGQGEYDAPQ